MHPAGDAEPLNSVPVNAAPVNRGAVPQPGGELEAALYENAQLKRQLARVADELESFTYSVSHDLRASLRHISAFVEIINEDLDTDTDTDTDTGTGTGLDAGFRGHLATITGAARHMTLMIDELMELSRLGRVELNLSHVAVRPLIDEVCESLQLEAQAESSRAQAGSSQAGLNASQAASIHWRIADDFPPLHADPVLVRQILQHLISNAIKFTRPAAERPVAEIEIGWRWLPDDARSGVPRHDALCELFIKDNGVGFNPKFGPKLFGVFQRLHSATEFEGIGMGLALSRRIVARHGGSINAVSPVFSRLNVPSQVVGGCELRFTLPVARAGNILNS